MTDDFNAKGEKRKHGRHPYVRMTLEYLRNREVLPGIVERLIPSKPFPKKVDLWNLFDLIYLDPVTNETVYIQVTSDGCRSEHKKKMLATAEENPSVLRIILAQENAHSDLYSWRKEKNRWEVTVERVAAQGNLLGKPDTLLFEPVGVPTAASLREKMRERERAEDF